MNRRKRNILGVLLLLCVLMTGFAAKALAATPTLTTQPKNTTAIMGETATFSVVASGSGLQYQWQAQALGSTSWKNSSAASAKTATLKITALAALNNYSFRCVVTDASGKTVTSNAATLTVKPIISAQPKSTTVVVGSTASFSVTTATTKNVTYQWQAKAPSADTWKNSSAASAKTANLKITAITALNNYSFRCVVTDASGKTSTSSAATLTVKPMISTHPKSTTVEVGSTASFSITTATTTNVTYQWQAKAPGADAWKNSGATGAKTSTMNITAQTAHGGYQFRCIVKDGKGNEYVSSAATLTVMPKITTQPKSMSVNTGATVSFSVAVTGKATLTYQWQSKAPGSDTWKNSASASAKTSKLSFAAQVAHNGFQFRCVITDGNGKKVTSNAATLTVKPGITAQPKDAMLAEKTTVTFGVTAVGKGPLKYQWQSKAPGSDTWKNSLSASAKTNTFSFTVQKGHQGYSFRCIVTDANGNKSVSNLARLTLCAIPVNSRFFPDNQLRFNASQYDSNRNGLLDANEIAEVKIISSHNIIDLSGIEFFTGLEEIHAYNVREDIDFSCNTELAKAEVRVSGLLSYDAITGTLVEDNNEYRVSFHDNKKLQELSCSGLIGSLDIGNCTQLTELTCSETRLTSLDLSNKSKLTTLNCSNNSKLTSIDLSNCDKIVELDCSGSALTSLNLSKCVQLLRLYCSKTNLTKLDVSNCKQLRVLECSSGKLNQLVLGSLSALQELKCSANVLADIDLSGCTSLVELYCQDNRLSHLYVSCCNNLEKLNCSYNQLGWLDLSYNTELKELNCEANSLNSLNVSYCKYLKNLNCSHNRLTNLSVWSTAYFSYSLESLQCNDNLLTSLSLSRVYYIENVDCSNNRISTLSITNSGLNSMNCSNNKLTSLDVGTFTFLKSLNCSMNQLTELELRNNTRLSSLQCTNNNITVLDISKTKVTDSSLSVDEGVIVLK